MTDGRLYRVVSPVYDDEDYDVRFVRARTRRDAVMAAVKDMRRNPGLFDGYFTRRRQGPPWAGFRAEPWSVQPTPGYSILSAAEVLAR